jgi:hypothetical protein
MLRVVTEAYGTASLESRALAIEARITKKAKGPLSLLRKGEKRHGAELTEDKGRRAELLVQARINNINPH